MSIRTHTPLEIRPIEGEEFLHTAHQLQTYAFDAGPQSPDQVDRRQSQQPYKAENLNLVGFVDEEPVVVAAGIPLEQNVRGQVLPMGGICSVATHPAARRRGHVRSVLDELHTQLRDAGKAVATLYPFQMSFYERFGYAGLPKPRRVRLFPDGLDTLLDVNLPGEVTLHRIGEAFGEYEHYYAERLRTQHGLAMFPRSNAVQLRDADRHWLALARSEGAVVGMLLYRTTGQGGELTADVCLWSHPTGRALLLRWLALHVGQISAFVLTLPPDEHPDLWFTNIRYLDETRIAPPSSVAPMGRVLRVDGLTGLEVGPSAVTVEVVDDRLIAGTWSLDGRSGQLEVRGTDNRPDATLTSPGLAALVYGVLDPADLEWRGYGSVPADARPALRTLFPPATPYLCASF